MNKHRVTRNSLMVQEWAVFEERSFKDMANVLIGEALITRLSWPAIRSIKNLEKAGLKTVGVLREQLNPQPKKKGKR